MFQCKKDFVLARSVIKESKETVAEWNGFIGFDFKEDRLAGRPPKRAYKLNTRVSTKRVKAT